MNRRTIPLLIGLFLLSLLAASSVWAQDADGTEATMSSESQEAPTVYDIIRNDPRLRSFRLLVDAAGLSDNLDQDGPFTVFAPTNEALAAFDVARQRGGVTSDEIGSQAGAHDLTPTDVLLYHVINGRYSSQALFAQRALPTLQGSHLLFDAETETIMLNDVAFVVEADIQAANGVVHIIDAVAPPPAQDAAQRGSPANTMAKVLSDDGRFETFLALARQTGLMETLDNPRGKLTLFAPTDEAFDNVPEELLDRWLSDTDELRTILSYHIVGDTLNISQIATSRYLPTQEGRALAVTIDEDVRVYLNGRPVQDFNLISANGFIHVVDEVVLP